MPAAGSTYVALLRGINVGGRNLLPMRALEAIVSEAGGRAVRSYIQSGNVLFEATEARARRMPALVAAAIAGRFGLSVPVVLRSARELRALVRANPLAAGGAEAAALHVAFLLTRPAPAAVRGREIYLSLPNGVARTRLTTGYFDARLGTTCTVRNWRTVGKLLEMAGG